LSDKGTAAVVLSNQIEARFEPTNTAKVAFVLHEGTKVHVERLEGTWALVSVPNGLRGWVPATSFERI
jgi:SH3-like domain-containing protein